MPFFAHFGADNQGSSPVIGWYDTTMFHYPNLPDSSQLIEMNNKEWAEHFEQPHGWTACGGQLIAPEK